MEYIRRTFVSLGRFFGRKIVLRPTGDLRWTSRSRCRLVLYKALRIQNVNHFFNNPLMRFLYIKSVEISREKFPDLQLEASVKLVWQSPVRSYVCVCQVTSVNSILFSEYPSFLKVLFPHILVIPELKINRIVPKHVFHALDTNANANATVACSRLVPLLGIQCTHAHLHWFSKMANRLRRLARAPT